MSPSPCCPDATFQVALRQRFRPVWVFRTARFVRWFGSFPQLRFARCGWHAVCNLAEDHIALSFARNLLNTCQIAEFAALIASQNSQIIESPQPIRSSHLQGVWTTSRNWLVEVVERLDELSAAEDRESTPGRHEMQPGLEEMLEIAFTSEMLLRVWGAVLTAQDNSAVGGDGSAATIARHLLVLQLHARQRALSVLVHEQLSLADVARIDRLRRKVERWADLLLGPLVLQHDTGEFAFDARRAREFGRDYFDDQTSSQHEWTWRLLITGLHSSFAKSLLTRASAQSGLQLLCDAILKCIPADAFYSDGSPRGALSARISRSGLKPESAPQRISPQAIQTLLSPSTTAKTIGETGISFSKLLRKQRPAN